MKNVRLNEPVTATLKIPDDLLDEAQAEELFFAYFYDDTWEYYTPDSIDIPRSLPLCRQIGTSLCPSHTGASFNAASATCSGVRASYNFV